MNRKPGLFETIRSLSLLLRGRPKVPLSLDGNPLLKVILNRRSVRSFIPKAIPEDVFAAILEAGRLAPSTVNLQTWSFAVKIDKYGKMGLLKGGKLRNKKNKNGRIVPSKNNSHLFVTKNTSVNIK
jgi:hypothetical protein